MNWQSEQYCDIGHIKPCPCHDGEWTPNPSERTRNSMEKRPIAHIGQVGLQWVILISKGGESDVDITMNGDVTDERFAAVKRGIHALLIELGPHPEEGYDIQVYPLGGGS